MGPSTLGSTPQSVGRGVSWMCTAMLLLVGMDAICKHLTASFPVSQVIWGRFTFHMIFLLPLMGRQLPQLCISRGLRFQLWRGGMILAASFMMVTGLNYMPLADVAVLFAVNPLFVTALSAPLLKEKVGPRQWIGVVVGFCGVVVILRPGMGVVHPAAGLLLAGALFYALSQIATRKLGAIDDTRTTTLYTAVVCTVGTTGIMPFVWVAPDLAGWLLIAAAGALSMAGHLAAAKAFQVAPAATVTPFNYSGLIWATLFGFLLFGDLPDGWTVAGGGVIVGSSLYVLARRRKRRQSED